MGFLIIFLRAGVSLCLVLLVAAAPAFAESLEYQVKAAYLSKFGVYVDWPAAAFAAPDSPMMLCIAGQDPFGDALDRAAAVQRINGHPLIVRRLGNTIARDAGCHILYLGFTDAARNRQTLDALRGRPVLTVGDAKGGDGGIITFVISDNRVRFNIDEAAAADSGLGISSKLLGLALHVRLKQPLEKR